MMRVRGNVLGVALSTCVFALLTIYTMNSASLETYINSWARAPMFITPETEIDKAVPGSGMKTIVWYDSYHKKHGLRNSVSNAKFGSCKGVAANCRILPHVIDDPNQRGNIKVNADAVLFQGSHLNEMTPPQRMHQNQVFVFAERENWLSDTYNKIESIQLPNLSLFKGVFNWTMSYRRDSDILLPYGEIRKLQSGVIKRDYTGIYKKKKHEAAWFVSHCDTPSLREDFVMELQKYITVHIYGKCGKFSCPRKRVERDSSKDCLMRAIEKHKFVLSFENSYRLNYVTEKLFDWFPRDIIPVVRGGGGDYSKYGVPEGTIIDADSYSSAKELALFLKYVGSNESLYTEYMSRKHGYYSVSINEEQTEGYCRLCEMLQNVQQHRKSYFHIGAWWDSDLFSYFYLDIFKVSKLYLFAMFCNLAISVLIYKCLVRKLLFH